MIQYITRKNIEIEKYNICIKNAKNSRIYAYSWYLDCVADHWDVLILNDYQAVMPLVWRSKYHIKYIYPPCWAQQLGVFSSENIKESLVALFLKSIPKKYKKQTIFLNTLNITKGLLEQTNYILVLNKRYKDLNRNYNKTRRRILKKIVKTLKIKTAQEYKPIIEFFKLHTASNLNITTKDYAKLAKLLMILNNKNKLIIKTAYLDNKLVAGSFFIIDASRIVYLFSTTNSLGKKENCMSFIIDAIIKEYENTPYLLDFEGSSVKGIAFFFKSFGAKKEEYYLYQKSFSLLK